MRIWYFQPYGAAPGFGKHLRPFYLAKEWQRLGHKAVCFIGQHHHLTDAPDPLPSAFEVDGVSFRTLKARPYKGNGLGRFLNMVDYSIAMVTATRDLQSPDVLIVSSPHPFTIFPGHYLAEKFGAKLVFEIRDIWPLSITEMTGAHRLHPIVLLSAWAERFAIRHADLIASLLGNAREHLQSLGYRGPFVHVPNAAPEEPLSTARAESPEGIKASAKINEWKREGRTIIVHPGTQGHPSALDALLYAARILKDERPDARFGIMLIGGGDTSGALHRLTAQLDLEDDVAFVPPVRKADALYLTRQCDIGYAGKRNFERVFRYGISFNKIIDFMEAGLPVILPITTKGDPVSNSGCGIVTGDAPADIASAIAALLDMTPDQRNELGQRGRDYLTHSLSYPAVARTYIDAIEQLGASSTR